jgi:hypothetical protein
MAREQNIACFRKSFRTRFSGFIAMVSGNHAARITFAIATLDTGQQWHLDPILLRKRCFVADLIDNSRADVQMAGDFNGPFFGLNPKFAQSPANLSNTPIFKPATWPTPHGGAVA